MGELILRCACVDKNARAKAEIDSLAARVKELTEKLAAAEKQNVAMWNGLQELQEDGAVHCPNCDLKDSIAKRALAEFDALAGEKEKS